MKYIIHLFGTFFVASWEKLLIQFVFENLKQTASKEVFLLKRMVDSK